MLIADARIHLWAADTPDRPWPPGGAQRAQKPYPVTKDMALAGMKEAGVDRLHPERFAVMGRLARGCSKAQPGMLGMRFTFNTEQQRPWLTDGTADRLWPAAERAGIPMMMSVSGQLPAVDRLAERYPGLKLVVDHMGLRSGTKGAE